jgi:hypothetical protein
VALVRTDVSQEYIASIIKVTKISHLGTTLAVTSNRSTLRPLLVTANGVPRSLILVALKMDVIRSSETSVLTTATRRHISEEDILRSQNHENIKSQIKCIFCLIQSRKFMKKIYVG